VAHAAELELSAELIANEGALAAEDCLLSFEVKQVEGMRKHNETAQAMGREPFTEAEIDESARRLDAMLAKRGRTLKSFEKTFSWAQPHAKGNGLFDLQRAVGLGDWSADYRWATQDAHGTYRDARCELGASAGFEGDDLLLSGPSTAGLTDPGHRVALASADHGSVSARCGERPFLAARLQRACEDGAGTRRAGKRYRPGLPIVRGGCSRSPIQRARSLNRVAEGKWHGRLRTRAARKLAEHLGFIERSCRAFDEGHTEEAFRIATSVRVMLHDTTQSTSILEHLGAKGRVKLLTTTATSSTMFRWSPAWSR
jgi:hypothetical protein